MSGNIVAWGVNVSNVQAQEIYIWSAKREISAQWESSLKDKNSKSCMQHQKLIQWIYFGPLESLN